jgi:hypothetical protein
MNLDESPFEIWTHIKEIHFRGRIMNLSCDLEYLLIKIIAAAYLDDPSGQTIKFEKMTMDKKIMFARRSLQEFYSDLFIRYK